jgi:VCBS repeat-containing protein
VAANPTGADVKGQGDDHLRLIKATLQATFPNADQSLYFPRTVATVAGNVTVNNTTDDGKHSFVSASAAARTVSLPSTSGLKDHFRHTVVKYDTSKNTVTITPNGADTINGAASYVMRRAYETRTFIWSSANSVWTIEADGGVDTAVPPIDATADFSVAYTDDGLIRRVSASAAARTVTLVNTVFVGFSVTVQKTDSTVNTVTIDGSGAGNINGQATIVLRYQFQSATFTYTGTEWICTYDPDASIPIGGWIGWFLETTPSSKWLFPEGQAISRTTYAALFAKWGTNYGVGDGSTTFNMPDFKGRFPRAWDHAAGVDPDAASRTSRGDGTTGDKIGTKQEDAFKSHDHSYTRGTNANIAAAGSNNGQTLGGNTTGATGGNETRPKNISTGIIFRVLP